MPYHPEYQACEQVFSWAKHDFKKRVLRNRLGKSVEITEIAELFNGKKKATG